MSTILTIAKLTFREASRRKILLAALLLGLAFLLVFGLGFHFVMLEFERQFGANDALELPQVKNILMMAGIYVVNFLTVMMTVLTSVDTISGEIQSGAIHTLASKPVRRWEIVAGKWLGFAAMLTLYLLLTAGGVLSIVFLRSDYVAPNPAGTLVLLWLNALVLLSVSLLGGTFLSTLANGVLVFGLYGVAFIGGWIEQIGNFLRDPAAGSTAINIGIITSLLMPSEALWKRAAHEIESPLATALGFGPFTSSTYPSDAMILYSLVYLAVATGLTIYQFNRRDL